MKKYILVFYAAIVAAAVTLADQLTKLWTVSAFPSPDAEYVTPFKLIPEVLHFTRVHNRGAGMGMLADHRWIFMTVSTVAIVAIAVYIALKRPKSALLVTSLSLIAGGGIGNMIDRVRLGYVVDMIDVACIDFYVFNVADSAVCIGCGLLVLYMILDEVRLRREQKAKR